MESSSDSETERVEDEQSEAPQARSRWREACSLVTVEPMTFIYAFYSSLANPMTQQYIRARVALDYNTTIPALNNHSMCTTNHSDPNYILLTSVQHETSSWMAYLSAAQLPFAILATLFCGSYSDKGGRKLGMIVPVAGGLLKTALLICVTVLELPKEVLFVAFIADGIGGGFGTFLMSTFAYVSDVTHFGNRALRIVVVESALGIGVVIGQLVFGRLPDLGFLYSFIIMAGVLLLALLYITLLLSESRVVTEKPKIFTSEHLKRLIEVYAKTDEQGRRWKLAISGGILAFASMVDFGRSDATLLFVQNAPLCWNATLLGYYGAISFVLSTIGSICLTKVLQCRVQDMVLVLIGTLSCMGQNVFQAFSTTTWMVFVAAVIAMFSRLTVQLLRSFASKAVSPDEQGAMYAAFAMIQVTGTLCGSVFFTTVYNVSMEWMLGFVFLVAAAFCFVCTILAGVSIMLQRSYTSRYSALSAEVST